jgi:hypothetical protein
MNSVEQSAWSGILISLDVLLDTRLGTLAKLGGSNLAVEVLKENYHTRKDDKFPNVDVDAFNAMYAARDEETLSKSYSTNIDTFLRELVHTLIKQALVRPFHQGVRVVVNTYPYQLSDTVTQQILGAVVDKLLADIEVEVPLLVEAEHLTDEQLNPEHCKQTYSAMLMYDYEHWLSMQQAALTKRPMPEVTLFAPAIYFVQTPTEEDIEAAKNEMQMHPFEILQKTLQGAVDLQLLPIELFSIVNPAK